METKELLEIIYPKLNLEQILSKYEPKDKGNYYSLVCPSCRERDRAYIYKGGKTIKCNRQNECGYSENLWDFIQKKTGFDGNETLKELARLANVEHLLEEKEYSEADFLHITQEKRRQALLTAVNDFYKNSLRTPAGVETLKYLTETRGYSEQEIESMGLGHNAGSEKTKNYLLNKGFSLEEVVDTLDLISSRDDHKLTFPYYNPDGTINTFYGRLISDGEKKYLNFSKTQKNTPFNFTHRTHGNIKDIIIVEGFLDALLLSAKGISGVIAATSSQIPAEMLKFIKNLKADHITLCLDGDKAGQKGTEKLIESLGLEKTFVITLPEELKDPDSFIKAKGTEEFKRLIEEAVSAAEFKAKRLLQTYDGTPKSKDKVIMDAQKFDEQAERIRDGETFLKIIAEGIGCSLEGLLDERQSIEQKRLEQQHKEELSNFYSRGGELISQGKFSEAAKLFKENKDLKTSPMARFVIKFYRVEDLEADLLSTPEGLKTGYKTIDEHIIIPQQAITIIGGRPAHGKTTFLMNLCLKMVEQYPDNVFPFFSYEEPKNQIALKMIKILAPELKGEIGGIRAAIKKGNITGKLANAYKEYKEFTESERLLIDDKCYDIDDLVYNLGVIKSKYNIGAVFIDYLQKINSKGTFGTRQLEIQSISAKLLNAAKDLSIPIILGAQMRRPADGKKTDTALRLDNLRECGDIEQDANLVIGILNKTKAESDRGDAEEASGTQQGTNNELARNDIELKVLKNRNGRDYNFSNFVMDGLVISEPSKT